jgi:hypothetical protein
VLAALAAVALVVVLRRLLARPERRRWIALRCLSSFVYNIASKTSRALDALRPFFIFVISLLATSRKQLDCLPFLFRS